MQGIEQVSFQIISFSGTAKSMYIEAIQKAKEGNYSAAMSLVDEGDNIFVEAHKTHASLIQNEACGDDVEFSILLMHAEDQMASCETIKVLAIEVIEIYKKMN